MTDMILTLPALEIKQNEHKRFYSFAVDGKRLPEFASISRIHRNVDDGLEGYQRPEVLSHISEIRSYIESENPLVPNSIIVAFDKRVKFHPMADLKQTQAGFVRMGYLEIPVEQSWAEDEKPGWIVDGQQRTAAIRDASVDQFPVSVTGFIAENLDEQRKQFILVNSTKPLPRGLIYELLPLTDGKLPAALEKRKFPAYLLNRLNTDQDSPFRGLINTPTYPDGLVKDNSVLKMLESSLSDGILYRYRDPNTGAGDPDPMLSILKDYWGGVAEVFAEAWGKSPKKSRLMHGAGVASMGHIMDAIGDRYGVSAIPSRRDFMTEISAIKDVCKWTNGFWDFGPGRQRKWNELQNTSRDIQLLSNFLLYRYRQVVS